jgi:hypothetical protein
VVADEAELFLDTLKDIGRTIGESRWTVARESSGGRSWEIYAQWRFEYALVGSSNN